MDKALRNTIIAGILLVSASVAFYFMYYLPNKQHKLETATKECSYITKPALSDTEREEARQNWEKLKCGNETGFKPLSCSTYKEKMEATHEYKVATTDNQFEWCLREKGLVN